MNSRYAIFAAAVIAGLFVSQVAAVNTEVKNVAAVSQEIHTTGEYASPALAPSTTPGAPLALASRNNASLHRNAC